MKLFNTLSRAKEDFSPQNPEDVTFYSCGPTVYDNAHIGNLRAYIFVDILKRTLTLNGFKVNHVMNLTDVDDKTIRGSKEVSVTLEQFTANYIQIFFEDLKKLNIIPASTFPRATEYIPQMIELIKALVEKGVAYESESSVYFDISKFPDYGKLARLDFDNLKTGTRVDVDEYSRDSVNDFVLWKAKKEDEPSWDSPWGQGRPGWHIECSAMSLDLLGNAFPDGKFVPDQAQTLDIHAAGVDLVFPHNEDEIAQSEAATGKQFVRTWVHNEHLLVNGTKMSKSLGNYFTLRDIEAKEIDPLAFRYLTLTAGYRDKLNFTWESLQAAQNALDNLYNQVAELRAVKAGEAHKDSLDEFTEALNDDLNTPFAIAALWKLVRGSTPPEAKLATLLEMEQVLGLGLEKALEAQEISPEAKKLLEQRAEAREAKDFTKSDQLRDELSKLGIEVKDTSEGQKWVIKKAVS